MRTWKTKIVYVGGKGKVAVFFVYHRCAVVFRLPPFPDFSKVALTMLGREWEITEVAGIKLPYSYGSLESGELQTIIAFSPHPQYSIRQVKFLLMIKLFSHVFNSGCKTLVDGKNVWHFLKRPPN